MARNHNWEERYQTEENLPWDTGEPAPELISFLSQPENSTISQALDIGCGTGTNAIWLAQKGISVVATDLAPSAIQIALKKAEAQGVKVDFKVGDICQTNPVPENSQDLVFDRGVFHVIPKEQRHLFAERAARALKPGGFWLCLAGSKDEEREDPSIGPPQLSALDIIEKIEPYFMVYQLGRSYFEKIRDRSYLAWHGIFRKR
jgi:ubiquinone/menaquinone biosynthesis C-methylase UbiE